MKHIVISIISLPMLMLVACAQEGLPGTDPFIEATGSGIVVCGGMASPGVSSRAGGSDTEKVFPEPSNFGVCNADKLKILTFRGFHLLHQFIPADLEYSSSDVDNLDRLFNYRDKWMTYTAPLLFSGGTGSYHTGFAFPTIAYSNDDTEKFTLSCEANTQTDVKEKYDNLMLCVTATDIPELYFGRLNPLDNPSFHDKFNDDYFDSKGIVYKKKLTVGDESADCALEGKLYRIVSQLNVSISDVNPAVDKIEMYLSNVPIQIGLYAEHHTKLPTEKDDYKDHGFFYPVVAADGDAQHTTGAEESDGILVCSVSGSDIREGKARLSTFLLPSRIGRTVILKAYFSKKESDGTITETVEECTLRASKDYKLTKETSEVYFSAQPLDVYKAATNEFYSYSNVRVNVSGCFNDIFAQEDKANVVIEICPNYDGEHEIEIK